MVPILKSSSWILSVIVCLFLAGCAVHSADAPAGEPVMDEAFLSAPVWDDGQAEVAFYRLVRTRSPYGEAEEQDILVGTYLVKHDFSPSAMSKAESNHDDGVASFKAALFYAFESGSYEYRRAWVTNARQSDLRPFKTSFTMFDWCANSYHELAIPATGDASYLYRSDDYGNEAGTFTYRSGSFPPALIPTFVRGLDFTQEEEHEFGVLLDDGTIVTARARLEGRVQLERGGGAVEADRVLIRYDSRVPSVIAEFADPEETYWRGATGERLLLAIEGSSGAYRLDLIEALRSAYWEEDLWSRLQEVNRRP